MRYIKPLYLKYFLRKYPQTVEICLRKIATGPILFLVSVSNVDISLTPPPPLFVHGVFERPLMVIPQRLRIRSQLLTSLLLNVDNYEAKSFTKYLLKVKSILSNHGIWHTIPSPQLSPEIIDPRKVDTNFLEADFEYFRVLEAREDV